MSDLSFIATAIGSLPLSNPVEAVQSVITNFKHAPYWPQLPAHSIKEDMNIQYSSRLPGVALDLEKGSLRVIKGPKFDAQVEEFYSHVIEEDIEYFAFPRNYAAGFYNFLEEIDKLSPGAIPFIKGHITGPVTHGLIIKGEDGKSMIYDEIYFDIIVKNLVMNARFQVNRFENVAPAARPIIFIDEPYLTSFGSAFVNISEELVVAKINEIVRSVKADCAVHCCGNTDWKLLLRSDIKILNFDAYEYMESLAIYKDDVNDFLTRGGYLAWGIVPSSLPSPEQIEKEDINSLLGKFDEGLTILERAGVDTKLVLAQSMITPSCGTGGMKPENAQKTLRLTCELADALRSRYS